MGIPFPHSFPLWWFVGGGIQRITAYIPPPTHNTCCRPFEQQKLCTSLGALCWHLLSFPFAYSAKEYTLILRPTNTSSCRHCLEGIGRSSEVVFCVLQGSVLCNAAVVLLWCHKRGCNYKGVYMRSKNIYSEDKIHYKNRYHIFFCHHHASPIIPSMSRCVVSRFSNTSVIILRCASASSTKLSLCRLHNICCN